MKRLSKNHVRLANMAIAMAVLVWPGIGNAEEPANQAEPARQWVVYVLPHSHVDIGYTALQPEVERKQMRNIDLALDLCRETADYPAGARFKWNTEVLWAVDSYLRKEPAEKQRALIEAVRDGRIGFDALYCNELTGLCRPEELLRLCDYARQLTKRYDLKIETAMISDVPGFTWGTVPALALAGVKYFSLGSNSFDGGRLFPPWQDKPFYWLGPDGRQKVLCWLPYKGYHLAHRQKDLAHVLPGIIARLEKSGYPYDVVQLRWSVGGDNGPPDVKLPGVVKDWNATHDRVKIVIATTDEMFREFEKRYADKIPVFSGDLTPFWENGACSSARETAVNRTAAERLVQAEILQSLCNPGQYPAAEFDEAWRNVLLYDEHTWGSHDSVKRPDLPDVLGQWKIKQAYALDADAQSQKLLASAAAGRGGEPVANAVDVFNTSSWPRTDLVVVGKEWSAAGDVVADSDGRAVPSQRLSTGQLAFLAQDVPPLAGRRYTVGPGKAAATGRATSHATAEAASLSAPAISVRIDPQSGAVVSLQNAATGDELCDATSGVGLNRYYYVPGTRVKDAQQAGAAKITVKEAGPLVASLVVESDAPGCAGLRREIRVVDGLDRVDIVNVLDKKAVREKEGVHFGFAFNVPDGVMRVDIPWAVMRPEVDQLPGSCKNWLSAGRWVDVSNRQRGVTWATLDAPMIEVGAITADGIKPDQPPDQWLAKLPPSQTLYSMVMNNHWWTNYKAEQEGPTAFRYSLRPHGAYDAGAAQRFGIEASQPLVAVAAQGRAPAGRSLLSVEPAGVVVTSIVPIEDGKALAIRLFNATGAAAKAIVRRPSGVSPSDSENASVEKTIDMAPWEIVTIREAVE